MDKQWVLLYSTGNYIQSLGIDNVEDSVGKGTCVCVCVCMNDWIISLNSRNWHNIVNHLYSNRKKCIKKL